MDIGVIVSVPAALVFAWSMGAHCTCFGDIKQRFSASIDFVERNDNPSERRRLPIADIGTPNADRIDRSCHTAHR